MLKVQLGNNDPSFSSGSAAGAAGAAGASGGGASAFPFRGRWGSRRGRHTRLSLVLLLLRVHFSNACVIGRGQRKSIQRGEFYPLGVGLEGASIGTNKK